MVKKRKTRIVALVATKGGVGKTTMAGALAVRAVQDGGKVALLDTDPQGSLTMWWQFRGSPGNPSMIGVDASPEAVELAIAQGWDWVIIDSPPSLVAATESILVSADLVVIPCKVGTFDVAAVTSAVAMCKRAGRPFAFLLNQVKSAASADGAEGFLENDGPVLKSRIGDRKAYEAAVMEGRSGPEVDRDGKATAEVDALWAEISALVNGKGKGRGGK